MNTPQPAQVAVFEEGWAGDKFYILLHGKLRVFKADVQLALLDAHPAEGGALSQTAYPFFGEMALMDAAPRMASVHTLSPCKILSLSRANFGRFLSLVPDFKDRVARTKAVRKKESEINVAGPARGPTKEDIAVSASLDDKLDDVHQILALQQAHIYPPHSAYHVVYTPPIPCRHSPYPVAPPLITAVTRYRRRYLPPPSPLPPSLPHALPPRLPLTSPTPPHLRTTLTLALAPTNTFTVIRCA